MSRANNFYMKAAFCAFLNLTAFATALASADNELRLSVELSLSKSSVKPCEKIDLAVTITNVDDQFEVTLPAVMADPYYWLRIELISPTGKRLRYEGPEFQIVGIEYTVTLFPSYYFGTSISLDCDSYDLRGLGEYEVSVVYGYGPTDRKSLPSIVKSNAQSFTVSD